LSEAVVVAGWRVSSAEVLEICLLHHGLGTDEKLLHHAGFNDNEPRLILQKRLVYRETWSMQGREREERRMWSVSE